MSRFPSRRVAGKKHIWIACRLDATGKVDARASDDPLFVIGTGETSNEREGGAKEKNCRQRQRLLPLLTLLLLKGKNRQRKRRRRRSVFLRPAAAAPWQSHRSHTEKPNLSSLFLASRATRGPTDAGGRTDGRCTLSQPPSLPLSLPLSLPFSSVGQSRSARDVLLGDGRGSAEAEETGALLPALTSDKPGTTHVWDPRLREFAGTVRRPHYL